MARCRLGVVARILLVIGVSVILAGSLAEVFGAKTESSWRGEEVLSENEYLALMLWAMTTRGVANIEIRGGSQVYYTVVRGDPLSLVANSTAFGVSIESTESTHDFRAGVFYAKAKVSMDPIALAFAISRFHKGNESMSIRLPVHGSLIALVVPKRGGGVNSSTVGYTVEFNVEGYSRLGFNGALAAGLALIALAVIPAYARCVARR